jgi:hypothetical protein
MLLKPAIDIADYHDADMPPAMMLADDHPDRQSDVFAASPYATRSARVAMARDM